MTDRRRPARLLAAALAVALASLAAVAAPPADAGPAPWRFEDVSRVVAFGDVHGAYDELLGTLRALEVVDADGGWSGGTTHVVSLGDVVDRGPRSRDVLDLLMRLQDEAARAGGAVHLALGNHEAMNVLGDLRYTAREEFAAFADEEPAAAREAAFERFARRRGGGDRDALRAAFDERYPPGFFGHRAAFGPDGRYGAWLLRRPAVIVIDGVAFVHGGLPPVVAELGAETLNARLLAEMRAYLDDLAVVEAAGLVPPEAGFADRKATLGPLLAAAPADAPWRAAAGRVVQVGDLLAHRSDGPLWYRRTAEADEAEEAATVVAALARLGATRSVHGHTVTDDRRVVARFDGRVLLIDTGVLASHYGGRPAALVIEDGAARAVYPAEGLEEALPAPAPLPAPPAEPRAAPADAEIEAVLATAEIVRVEDLGTGVTKPKRLTLRAGEREVRAIFKSFVETAPKSRNAIAEIQSSDRYVYEVAAYRLDRMLGLGMVPPTVLRTIDGVEGAVQAWVEGAVDERGRVERNLRPADRAGFEAQIARMHLFDVLIHNTDRNQQNLLYSPVDGRVHLIDHTRAFRVGKGRPPSAKGADLALTPDLEARLAALDQATLAEALGDLLQPAQIGAVLQRRDGILKDARRAAAAGR